MVVYTLEYASLNGPAIDLHKMPILVKKKLSFQMKLILIWRVCQQAKLPHAYIKTQNESLFDADFDPEA